MPSNVYIFFGLFDPISFHHGMMHFHSNHTSGGLWRIDAFNDNPCNSTLRRSIGPFDLKVFDTKLCEQKGYFFYQQAKACISTTTGKIFYRCLAV